MKPTDSVTIQHQLSHRSIRKFTAEALPQATVTQLINVARMASTSNHLQSVSIIRITDPAKRTQLREYASNQQYVQDAPEFWVFCADFYKHQQICPEAESDWTEVMLIGAIDAGIMAQNVVCAAESLGLGAVYIGSIRNQIEKVGELLELPTHTVPLIGLCLGYPDQDPPLKPRLPQSLMCFENAYQQPLDHAELQRYDETVAQYYRARSQIEMNWSRNVAKTLAKPVRPQVLPYLQKQGFVKR